MLPAKSSQAPLNGQFIWRNGTLVFGYYTKAKQSLVVGTGALETMINFINYLNENSIPNTSNIKVIRRLYHRFSLENILNQNGIDMQPATEPAMAKGNFRVLTSLKLVSTSVLLVYTRKLFKRVAGVFY